MTTDIIVDIIKSVVITICSSLITGLIVYFKARYKKEKEMNAQLQETIRMLKEAIKKLLRSNILGIHEVYYNRGYCPLHVKEALQETHDLYEDFKGNGLGDKMFEEVMALPEQTEVDIK